MIDGPGAWRNMQIFSISKLQWLKWQMSKQMDLYDQRASFSLIWWLFVVLFGTAREIAFSSADIWREKLKYAIKF